MSKLKHTKGPWVYNVPKNKLDIEEFPFISVSNHEGGTRKGFVSICHIDYGKETQYKEANAKLIAAAPEMLDALIDYFIEEGGSDIAKKAIEKATGLSIDEAII